MSDRTSSTAGTHRALGNTAASRGGLNSSARNCQGKHITGREQPSTLCHTHRVDIQAIANKGGFSWHCAATPEHAGAVRAHSTAQGSPEATQRRAEAPERRRRTLQKGAEGRAGFPTQWHTQHSGRPQQRSLSTQRDERRPEAYAQGRTGLRAESSRAEPRRAEPKGRRTEPGPAPRGPPRPPLRRTLLRDPGGLAPHRTALQRGGGNGRRRRAAELREGAWPRAHLSNNSRTAKIPSASGKAERTWLARGYCSPPSGSPARSAHVTLCGSQKRSFQNQARTAATAAAAIFLRLTPLPPRRRPPTAGGAPRLSPPASARQSERMRRRLAEGRDCPGRAPFADR